MNEDQVALLEELQAIYNLLYRTLDKSHRLFPVGLGTINFTVLQVQALTIRDDLRPILGKARYQLQHSFSGLKS